MFRHGLVEWVRRWSAWLGVLAVALSSAACNKSTSASTSTVVVSVKAAPSMPKVTQLRVVVTYADSSFDTRFFPSVNSDAPIAFDTSVTLILPDSRSG